MNEITYNDGMRGILGGSWWRFEKSTGALGKHTFCRGEGADIVAGLFDGGEDVPMIEAKVKGLSPEGARVAGKAICRALYDAYVQGGVL